MLELVVCNGFVLFFSLVFKYDFHVDVERIKK